MLMNLSLIKILSIEFRKEWNLSRTGIWKHQNLTLMLPRSQIIFWYIKQNAPVVEAVYDWIERDPTRKAIINSSVRKIQIDWQIVVKFSELVKGLPEDQPIFVGESIIYNSTVNDVLTRHCRECSISEISIHGLRHTHASLLLFAGVSIASVARRLGHASIEELFIFNSDMINIVKTAINIAIPLIFLLAY